MLLDKRLDPGRILFHSRSLLVLKRGGWQWEGRRDEPTPSLGVKAVKCKSPFPVAVDPVTLMHPVFAILVRERKGHV